MSRWVSLPDHATDVEGGLPQGFRASGVACGLKPSGGVDMGLLVSDTVGTVSAARFTRSGVLAAPVILCQERCRLDSLRAVVANAGNANAATGRRGVDNAARMQGAAAMAVGLDPEVVAVASTGVIGVQLPDRPITQGILAARGELSETGDEAFGEAIRTTDLFPKRACVDVTLPSGTVRISAQAKGAGMISPNFATMLCFVQTDAALAPETADLLLGVCVKRSFDRISVDGQLSTNDTAILMASGASGVRIVPESDDELRFGEALDAILRRLALLIVRDGEGAKRVGRVVVNGGHEETVERRGAGGRQLAARQGRAARRRPQLGPHRAGGRRRAARHRAARRRHLDRGRPGLLARRGGAVRPAGAARRRSRARRSSTRSGCPARASRPRSSSPTSRTTT